jgi:predicted SAM-dependent methyltransferase
MYKRLKRIIYYLSIPLIRFFKKIQWKTYLWLNDSIKLVVGAGKVKLKGWFNTDITTLDVTKGVHFRKYFSKKKIDNVLAEHVLEHLTEEEIQVMIINFYKHSSDSVNIRIAVPDGYHPDDNYIEMVRPGGTGEGAFDHKHLFNYKTLAAMFENNGFISLPVEYWDELGKFHNGYKNDANGFVTRSFINDERNLDGIPRYTSLIIDFKKK